jgi:hypothetical protein
VMSTVGPGNGPALNSRRARLCKAKLRAVSGHRPRPVLHWPTWPSPTFADGPIDRRRGILVRSRAEQSPRVVRGLRCRGLGRARRRRWVAVASGSERPRLDRPVVRRSDARTLRPAAAGPNAPDFDLSVLPRSGATATVINQSLGECRDMSRYQVSDTFSMHRTREKSANCGLNFAARLADGPVTH